MINKGEKPTNEATFVQIGAYDRKTKRRTSTQFQVLPDVPLTKLREAIYKAVKSVQADA